MILPYTRNNSKGKILKDIQQSWYDTLKAEGFDDIEKLKNGKMLLRSTATHDMLYVSPDIQNICEDYYSLIGELIESTKFNKPIEKTILELYNAGSTITNIKKILKQQNTPRCWQAILYCIRRYEMKWGIRTYKPRQLGRHP